MPGKIRKLIAAFIALTLAVIIAIAALQVAGPSRFWSLFGPEDLGTVDFKTLKRRSTPNDALACPPGLCSAKADLESPVFEKTAQDLRTAFARMIAEEERVERVEADDAAMTERYIERSRLLGFPDTIAVQFVELPDNKSTLALYSRSRFGAGDMGVNKARLNRWLSKLQKIAD